MSLTDLFAPNSIAVVGASKTPGKLGNDAMANAKKFDGPVYPVNPSREGTVCNRDFVDSVSDTDADLALCCVPGPATPDVIEECGEAGVGAVVVFAGGFAESGDRGKELQMKIGEIAEKYDITVLGPNTAGHIIPHRNLFSSFVPGLDEIESGNVAIAAQSGGVGLTATFQLDREGYGTAGMYGLGNRVNTDIDDIVPMLDKDPEADAIALHIEGTTEFDAAIEAIEQASTPIVALKSGHNMPEFIRAHTGAPIQEHKQYEQAFTDAGAVMADSITELIDASRILAQYPQADGSNIGLVTTQAGPGIIMADYLNERSMKFPELAEETRERLDDILTGVTYHKNPIDTGRPIPEFGDVIEAVGRDDNIDIVLVYEMFEHPIGYPIDELKRLTKDIDKPIVFTAAGPDPMLTRGRQRMETLGVATFSTPERGAHAASVLAETSK